MRKKLKTPGLKTKRRSAIRMNGGAVNSSCAGCWGKEHHHEQFFDTCHCVRRACGAGFFGRGRAGGLYRRHPAPRSEEHTSELQSRGHLVCRLLLEKKKRAPQPGESRI